MISSKSSHSHLIYSSLQCVSILVMYQFICFFFFFNDTATTEIYTLSLHDALPILMWPENVLRFASMDCSSPMSANTDRNRSEEHTSELQSPCNLVCRLLLEKKKQIGRHRFMSIIT